MSQPSISRELARNSGERGYRHRQAHRKSCERRSLVTRTTKLAPTVIALSTQKLNQYWSPEQISGWLLEEQEQCLRRESIYLHVWADKRAGGVLHSFQRRRGKRYQWRGSNGKTSRGQIKNRVSIDERLANVDKKEQTGHWEMDTVIGKGSNGLLVTIV